VENRKRLKIKTDLPRSIGSQSGKFVESVPKKKNKATVSIICRKGRFEAWNESVRAVAAVASPGFGITVGIG